MRAVERGESLGSIGDLFEPEPEQWGLRGDPLLWRELRGRLSGMPLPRRESQLWLVLEDAFQEAVGHPLWRCDEAYVERFAHGGMSSGYISQEFWTRRGFPLVVSRFSEIRMKDNNVKAERGAQHRRA